MVTTKWLTVIANSYLVCYKAAEHKYPLRLRAQKLEGLMMHKMDEDTGEAGFSSHDMEVTVLEYNFD